MLTHAASLTRRTFAHNRLLQVLLCLYGLVWVWAAIRPLYPHDWMMENILVVVFLPVLVLTHKRFPLSDLGYVCIFLFLCLHALGAHYTYSNVPLGFWLKEVLNTTRNPFDRLVHFCFGLFMAYPAREIFMRVAHTKGFWNYYLPLDIVLATSAIFELFEMGAAKLTAPELGDAYLGTQGDIWDAQMDMLMATLGAVLVMGITWTVNRWRMRRDQGVAMSTQTRES